MKSYRKSQFTLIELLAVIGLLSVLIGIFAPAFSRMLVGSKVDQMASNFKTGMEVAQSKAVASRKYVAMILPNKYDSLNSKLRPYCNGGYRLAYVKKDGNAWKFVSWVPGSNWSNIADGAMLVNIQARKNWYEKENPDPNEPEDYEFKSLPATNTDAKESSFWNTVDDKRVSALIAITDSTGDSDMSDLGHDENRSGIIFSPLGGSVNTVTPLLFFFTEAKINDSEFKYPNTDNFLVLRLNSLTCRVTHLAPED